VAVLRDPATRIVSDYFYTMHGAWIPENFKVRADNELNSHVHI
jgi:hypothetical protein